MAKGLISDPNAWLHKPLGDIFDCLRLHGVPSDMTLRELQVLNKLAQGFLVNEEMTQADLIRVTELPKATVARYIWNWLAVGWLKENIDPKDRRRHLLRLTDDAIKTSEEMTASLKVIHDGVVSEYAVREICVAEPKS
jgi:DNA-binding MarR family transcriptional regulator